MSNESPSAGATSLGKRKRGRVASSENATPLTVGSPSPSSNGPPDDLTATPGNSRDNKERCKSPVDGQDPTRKTKTAPKPKPRTKPKSKQPVTASPSSNWPPYLTHLEKTHRALNLVSTFFSARRHVAPTFETLRPAVEAHTKCPLVIEDVAAVVALRSGSVFSSLHSSSHGGGGGEEGEGGREGEGREPRAGLLLQRQGRLEIGSSSSSSSSSSWGIRFEYVDEVELAISIGGATAETERDRSYFIPDGEMSGERKEVLVFEFLDGELKAAGKGGGRVGDREDRMKMPVFGQAQMKRLIERRNIKFVQAANEFVESCLAEGLDPEMVLKDAREGFIPGMTEAVDHDQEKLPSTLPASIPRERKSIPEIVQELKDSPWYTGQIVPDGHRVFEAQEAVYGELNFLLSQDLVNALYNTKGITQFFAHQAEAINALHDGYNVVVATSTSSGKSLIYQLPVVHALEQDHNTRAMYIFPTKALAQDQKRSLQEIIGFMPGMEEVLVETFDGDTPMSERMTIRDEARIIFTNPDMLHITILPNEEKWRTFLKYLKYVVGRSPPHLSAARTS